MTPAWAAAGAAASAHPWVGPGTAAAPRLAPRRGILGLVGRARLLTFVLGLGAGSLAVGLGLPRLMTYTRGDKPMGEKRASTPVHGQPAPSAPASAPTPARADAPTARPPAHRAQARRVRSRRGHPRSADRKRLGFYVRMARASSKRHKWRKARYYARRALRIRPSHRTASRIKIRAERKLGL